MEITFRNFVKEDRESFFVMVKKFYAPPAVLHFPSDEVMLSAFDAAIEMPEFVKGRSPASVPSWFYAAYGNT